jgi:hypothetical protein
MFVYTSEFGGLKGTIEQAKAYRSGAITYHKFGFVQRFFPLNSILLYYLFYKVVLEKSQQYRKILTFFLMISALFTLLTMAIYSSRGFVIFELVGLYILTAIYHKNYYLKYLIPSMLAAFVVIKYGNPITNSLSDFTKYGFEEFVNAVMSRVEVQAHEGKSIISNFTHPIVSLEASLQLSGVSVEYRYFKDIWFAFLSLLPNQLLGIKDPQSLMQLNTLILQGKEVDQILPGALGFFSYSLNVVGVFIGSFVYGIFGAYLYKLFIQFYKSSKTSLIYIYFITLTFGYFVFRGTPTNVVQEKFMLMVVLFLIFFFSKIVIKKVDNQPTS